MPHPACGWLLFLPLPPLHHLIQHPLRLDHHLQQRLLEPPPRYPHPSSAFTPLLLANRQQYPRQDILLQNKRHQPKLNTEKVERALADLVLVGGGDLGFLVF